VFGTVLIGAVHDFGALAMSARRGGRTIGDIAGQLLGPRARVYFLLVLILLTWIIIAVFAFVIAVLFTKVPQSVWPVNFEILVAVIIGWWIYRRGGKLFWPSIIAVTLLYVTVFICADHPEWGTLPPSLQLYGTPIVTWIVFLMIYAYIASVLPVRVLLQPRDFINSHQLFIGLAALVIGIIVVRPEVTAPAFNHEVGLSVPMILPFLFITIACGAISGFHGLVSSGTTSKQLDRMRDARHVGYGGMLGEGVLATLAIVAVTAGLGSAAEWHARYADWKTVASQGIANFVDGAGNILQPILLGDLDLARTVVAVIVISFAATTLDTAARIQRFCMGELGSAFKVPALQNRFLTAAVAVIPAALLAIFTQDPARGPGSGGFILWPLFGTTNQLVGGLTLLLLVVHLRARGKPYWPIAVPMVFLVLMTTWAGVLNLHGQLVAETKNWPVVVFGIAFLLLEVLMFVEAIRILRAQKPGTPSRQHA
jgi:carbon starvation protein